MPFIGNQEKIEILVGCNECVHDQESVEIGHMGIPMASIETTMNPNSARACLSQREAEKLRPNTTLPI